MAKNVTGTGHRLTKVLYDQIVEYRTSSKTQAQRERNHTYYTLQPMGNEQKGRSHYISPDVFDVVESKKAYFAESYLTSRHPVKFRSDSSNTDHADARTEYVTKQLRLNNIDRLLRDGWHDAFVAKRMSMLVEWEEDSEMYQQPINGVPLVILQQSIDGDPSIIDIDTSGLEMAKGPDGRPVANGTLGIKKDKSHTKLTLLQPERYFRDMSVSYVDEGMYAGYEEDVARVVLINRGFDPEQIRDLKPDYSVSTRTEDSSRNAHGGSAKTGVNTANRTTETELVTFRRTWTWIQLSDYFDEMGDETVPGTEFDLNSLALYEIHWANREILRKEDGTLCIYPADEIPVFEWTEHKISHSAEDMATADVVAHTQKTNSTLKRLVIDNQQQRNTSRYEAVQGKIINPRELLDNSIGGVVWSRQLGSVAPLATPELSPMVQYVMEMLSQDKEERSGVSRLAQGLNTDVVSKQNAADMIERLTNSANRRIMRSVRDFATTFYIPMCKYIFKLGTRNDSQTHTLTVNGNPVQVSPMDWDETENDMVVSVALTPEERLQHAQMLLMLHQAQSQDPQVAMMYGVNQRHALFSSVYEAIGITDSSPYLMRPDGPEFKTMMDKAQADMLEQKQKAAEAEAASKELVQLGVKARVADMSLRGVETQLKLTDQAADNKREDRKLDHQIEKDRQDLVMQARTLGQQAYEFNKEMELEAKQRRPVAVSGVSNK